MTKLDSKAFDALHMASHAVSLAVILLKVERETFEKFLAEARAMEDFGHIVDPTLYKSPDRRAVNAVVKPLFEAAITFIEAYDYHIMRAKLAPEKVTA